MVVIHSFSELKRSKILLKLSASHILYIIIQLWFNNLNSRGGGVNVEGGIREGDDYRTIKDPPRRGQPH